MYKDFFIQEQAFQRFASQYKKHHLASAGRKSVCSSTSARSCEPSGAEQGSLRRTAQRSSFVLLIWSETSVSTNIHVWKFCELRKCLKTPEKGNYLVENQQRALIL